VGSGTAVDSETVRANGAWAHTLGRSEFGTPARMRYFARLSRGPRLLGVACCQAASSRLHSVQASGLWWSLYGASSSSSAMARTSFAVGLPLSAIACLPVSLPPAAWYQPADNLRDGVKDANAKCLDWDSTSNNTFELLAFCAHESYYQGTFVWIEFVVLGACGLTRLMQRYHALASAMEGELDAALVDLQRTRNAWLREVAWMRLNCARDGASSLVDAGVAGVRVYNWAPWLEAHPTITETSWMRKLEALRVGNII
jgi:hypothetical protein